jgi:hypothetical protein
VPPGLTLLLVLVQVLYGGDEDHLVNLCTLTSLYPGNWAPGSWWAAHISCEVPA